MSAMAVDPGKAFAQRKPPRCALGLAGGPAAQTRQTAPALAPHGQTA